MDSLHALEVLIKLGEVCSKGTLGEVSKSGRVITQSYVKSTQMYTKAIMEKYNVEVGLQGRSNELGSNARRMKGEKRKCNPERRDYDKMWWHYLIEWLKKIVHNGPSMMIESPI
ncbi:hypothetical protein TSUD_299010 [Trifolium subterraneum]|nr:hypothetical protein TSUD_299010 [Trifolium subterraneum]